MCISFSKILGKNKGNLRGIVYNAVADEGSSGSPIILINTIKIIGFHKGTLSEKFGTKLNIGIYLDEIILFIPKSTHLENKNVIKFIYYIKEEDTTKDILVYDNHNNIEKYIKSYSIYRQDNRKREIINGKFRFEREGKYIISYHLNELATNLSTMFNKCTSLIKVFMPSFAENKFTDMSRMFEELKISHICFLIVVN